MKKKELSVDWKKPKQEYIAGGISYRKLAEKHNVPFHSLRKVAAKEKWRELRDECAAKAATKIIDIESDKQAERMNRLITVSDKLLSAVEKAVEEFQAGELLIDRGALRSLAGAIKDIKDIQSIKTKLDIEEQKARIAILKKQAEGNGSSDDSNTGVLILPSLINKPVPPTEDDDG